MNSLDKIKPYSKAIVALLKGIVEKDDAEWRNIIAYQGEILDYLNVIGLDMIVRKDEGFAFVKQLRTDDDKTLNLASRIPLGFEASVILIVLRQKLEDFDCDPTESQSTDLYVTVEDLFDDVSMLIPQSYNSVRNIDSFRKSVSRLESLGFLVKPKDGVGETSRYRVHRVIKEKITINDLEDFKSKLTESNAESVIGNFASTKNGKVKSTLG